MAELTTTIRTQNFGQSISYTLDPAILESTEGFCFTKQIFQKFRIFNEMNMVNNLQFLPHFAFHKMWDSPSFLGRP